MSSGKLFQTAGAACEKAQSTKARLNFKFLNFSLFTSTNKGMLQDRIKVLVSICF